MMLRLTSFQAQNFRSVADVRMDHLPPVVLLYGHNNVGKSNLLRAIGAWLRLLGHRARSLRLNDSFQLEPDLARKLLGGLPEQQFRYGQSTMILGGRLSQADEEGIACTFYLTLLDSDERDATQPSARVIEVRVTELSGAITEPGIAYLEREPWLRIRSERRFHTEFLSAGLQPGEGPASDGQDLKQRLFRASNSRDKELLRAYKDRFLAALRDGPFKTEDPRTVIDENQTVELYVEDQPIAEQGSGVQQWVLVAGLLAMSRAGLAGIEEPEINLGWDAQVAMARWLRETATDVSRLPWQIFVSSHSPFLYELCAGGPWFRVYRDQKVTRIERHEDEAGLEMVHPAPPTLSIPPEAMYLYPGNVLQLKDVFVRHLGSQVGEYVYASRQGSGEVSLMSESRFDEIERSGQDKR